MSGISPTQTMMIKRNTGPASTHLNGANGSARGGPPLLHPARHDVPILIQDEDEHKDAARSKPSRGGFMSTFISTVFPRTSRPSVPLHPAQRSKLRRRAFYRDTSSRRRWSLFQFLAVLLWLASIIEGVVLILSMQLMNKIRDPIKIPLQRYPSVIYEHIDTKRPIALPNDTRIYHVTKEFGPASMGGLGTVLTALATAQQQTPHTDVSIIMPSYNLMRVKFKKELKKLTQLSVSMKDRSGKHINVGFKVHKFDYEFSHQDFLDPDPEIAFHQYSNSLTVYLIGAGDVYPFSHAFRAKDMNEIYSSPKGLPQEWMDLYFNKAAAEFIAFQSLDDTSLFATKKKQLVAPDVVHIHGATNAFLTHYLKDFERRSMLGANPPSIVYTMHDYLDELQYSVTINNLRHFIGSDGEDIDKELRLVSPYIHGHRLFTSAMGIDAADMVTFVSQVLAKDIVEGKTNFFLKELVMPSIIDRARQGQYVGITNGIDFNPEKNPFTNPLFLTKHLNFPRPDDIMDPSAFPPEYSDLYPPEKETLMSAQKHKAKKFLIQREQLPAEDEDKPLVLFIGRFQYNKGCEFFRPAAEAIAELGGKLIIMGQRNNYPLHLLRELHEDYPETVIIIHSALVQKKHGAIWRSAADFLLVPSLTESFGLVAVEGLLFGSGIISTGVGGLREFLIDEAADDSLTKSNFNAYLFNPISEDSTSQLKAVIGKALHSWREREDGDWIEREAFIRRMVRTALQLSWDRKDGPVEMYARVYQRSMDWRLQDLDGMFEPDGEDDDAALHAEEAAAMMRGDTGFDVVDGRIVAPDDLHDPYAGEHLHDSEEVHVHSHGSEHEAEQDPLGAPAMRHSVPEEDDPPRFESTYRDDGNDDAFREEMPKALDNGAAAIPGGPACLELDQVKGAIHHDAMQGDDTTERLFEGQTIDEEEDGDSDPALDAEAIAYEVAQDADKHPQIPVPVLNNAAEPKAPVPEFAESIEEQIEDPEPAME